MLILGLDPGTARLGYGLVEITLDEKGNTLQYIHAGCLETKMETPMGERLLFLSEALDKILQEYNPDIACVEQLFFGVNARTAIAVGQARGVILTSLARHKVPQVDYQGLSVKFAIAGTGKADKKMMQESVRKHLKMKEIIKPDDAADGLAIALTHYFKTMVPQVDNKVTKKAVAKKSKKK